MKVAVVGNRTGWAYEEIEKVLDDELGGHDEIISGGAEGVDTFAQVYAKKCGLKITIYYPDPLKPHPQRYYERNQEIVDIAEKLIAFQNNPHRSGTQSTINRARKKGIEVVVITKEDMKVRGRF